MSSDYFRHSAKLALVLAAFALVGTTLLALTFDATKDNILANEKRAKLALIAQILPSELVDNDILSDAASLSPQPALGTSENTLAYRAYKDGKPSAVVLEAIAPDGYSGKIKLLIAIKANAEISGVRVVSHKETPGLGDYIEIAKSEWIHGFDAASLEKYPAKDWKVKKDGGHFDSVAGATITPRAMVKAVYKALGYFSANRDELFSLPAQSQEQAK